MVGTVYDFPNQVNNVLSFPDIFHHALDVHAKEVDEEMRLAAVYASTEIIADGGFMQIMSFQIPLTRVADM